MSAISFSLSSNKRTTPLPSLHSRTLVPLFPEDSTLDCESSLLSPTSISLTRFPDSVLIDATQTSNFPIGVLTVNTTDPYWVFCEQTGHCQQGMVFAINPGNQFAAFQAAATGQNASTTAATATAAATGAVTVTATVTVNGGGETLTTTYGSYPGSAQPTSGTSQDHKIVVGGNGIIAFNPPNITAQPGDTITFQFNVKNHTVTQSNFAQPCRQLAQTSTTGQVGFNSGFMPVAANATTFPTFTIQVNDVSHFLIFFRSSKY